MINGLVICINNNKGGSLKTTTTTNLAGVLASKKKNVLIIDTDNQSNVSLSFGENPDTFSTSLYDVLLKDLPATEAIRKVHKYIDVLPSNDDLISFDFDVIGNIEDYPEPFTIMKERLDVLRESYDYILIDTPPSLSLMVGNVFAYADYVLIPYAPEYYSMRSLSKVVKTINDFRDAYNKDLRMLGVVRTLVVSHTNLHMDIIQETSKYALKNNIHLFDTVIPRTIQFANSVAYNKKPATMVKKRDKANLYFELWEEIEKILERAEA